MGIDLDMAAWLSAFRIEHMRLTGRSIGEATQAALDWVHANADWRLVSPVQAATMAKPSSVCVKLA